MANKTFISVIIPTYNRPQAINNCLEALFHSNYLQQFFEVIVVDDGSKESIHHIIKSYEKKMKIKLIEQSNSGPAAARNRGALHAQGDIIAFTDDDCLPHCNWLLELEKQFVLTPDALLGGNTINQLKDNIYCTASQLLIDYIYSYFNKTKSQFFTSNNMALATKNFRKIGGFDIGFPLAAAEDREFCESLLHEKFQLVYTPQAIIYHAHTLQFFSFYQQHFNYGRGAYYFHLKCLERDKSNKIEPLKFYINLLLYPFRRKQTCSSLLLSFLLFVSQLANVLGFFTEKWNTR